MSNNKEAILADIKKMRDKQSKSQDSLEKLIIESYELVPLYIALGKLLADEADEPKRGES